MTMADPMTLPARVREKFAVDDATGCWVWRGAKQRGYGAILWPPRSYKHARAHRVVYEMLVGPIPEGLYLDHLCRNRPCVNPDHLEPVTHAENVRRGLPASATHCKYGHEFSEQNTRRVNGRRVCVQCANRRRRESAKRRRTHCKNGHLLTDESTRVYADGRRFCRECEPIVRLSEFRLYGRLPDGTPNWRHPDCEKA